MTALQALALLVCFVLAWKWLLFAAIWLVTVPLLLAAKLLVRVPLMPVARFAALLGAAALGITLWLDTWIKNGAGDAKGGR